MTHPIYNYAPGVSSEFERACGKFDEAQRAFRDAQIAEIRYQLNYLSKSVQDAGIKNYGITDPVSNIGSLIDDLFPLPKQ